MASRKWRLVLVAVPVMLVGWFGVFVGTQTIMLAKDTREAANRFTAPAAHPYAAPAAASYHVPSDSPRNESDNQLFSAEEVRIRQLERAAATAAQQFKDAQKELAELKKRQREKQARNEETGDLSRYAELPVAASRTTWEYKSAEYSDDNANELGKQGWELVTVYAWGGEGGGAIKTNAVYKRPVDANTQRSAERHPHHVIYQQSENSTRVPPTPAAATNPAPGESEH